MRLSIGHWLTRLNDSDRRIREEARLRLGGLGPADADSIPELLGGLQSTDSDVRFWSIVGLGAVGRSARAATLQLVDALRDGVPRNRQAAAAALGKIRPVSRDAVAALSHVLATADSPFLRREALQTLGQIGAHLELTIPSIVESMRHEDELTREWTETALVLVGQNQPDRIVPLLTDQHEAVSDSRTREILAAAIKRIQSLPRPPVEQ